MISGWSHSSSELTQNGVRQQYKICMSYIASELFCQLVTPGGGGLFHSLIFAAAVSVETLLGKKGPAVASSIELSHLELV